MPNLAHPLFSAPAHAVNSEMVRGFLGLELEESFTVDYKRNIAAADDTVAAMANTYGGVILIGVDARPKDENLPGDLVGVKVIDKDRLVSKMANTFDPPGWAPEVIPVTVDDKLLLVVRVDPDTVPRPLFHQGVVRIRMDGRNLPADRRLVQMMFQQADPAPASVYVGDPRLTPDQYAAPHVRTAYHSRAPDLVIRAAVSRPLRQNAARLRLYGTTVDALTRALSTPGTRELHKRLAELTRRVNFHLYREPWTIDPEHGSAGFVRLGAGHKGPDAPTEPGAPSQAHIRSECSVTLAHGGSSLEVLFDLLFWTGGQKIASDLWMEACYEAVRTLVRDALPVLTEELLGTAFMPTPPVELHIATGEQRLQSLDSLLNTDILGLRTGTGNLRRGSEYLPDELVATDDLPAAVSEALRNIALDWRYLHPDLPRMHG